MCIKERGRKQEDISQLQDKFIEVDSSTLVYTNKGKTANNVSKVSDHESSGKDNPR